MRLLAFLVLGSLAVCAGASAGPLHFDASNRWIQLPVSRPEAHSEYVLFGDVNGDGAADLVLYNLKLGEAYVALSNRHGFGVPTRFATGLPTWNGTGDMPQANLADVNGDGKADLIVLNRGADNIPGAATARVALSTGTSFVYPPNPIWNTRWCANYQTCLFGDLNGDRKADMAAFTPNFGTLWESLSTGNAFASNATWNRLFCIRGEVCALGDVDGDGKADAIVFKPHAAGAQKGNVLVARSTGSAFVDVRYGHGFFCIDQEQCLVGDVNGDRRADIVLIKRGGVGSSTLEVLVSLSNGKTFTNAIPFQWAKPGYFNASNFGSVVLADVTGDGRADLIEFGSTSRAVAGSQQTTGFAVDVFAVTDRAVQTNPAPPTPKPAQPGGFSAVNVYNCHPDQNRLTFWNFDNTTGSVSQTGPVDAMYSATGFCPDPEDSPRRLPLVAGHIHTIVAVDPLAIGCDGRNDPSIVGCINNSASFSGSASGGICNWIVSAQAPGCVH